MNAFKALLPLLSFGLGVVICYFFLAGRGTTSGDSNQSASIDTRQRTQANPFRKNEEVEEDDREPQPPDETADDVTELDDEPLSEGDELPAATEPPATTQSWYPVDARSSVCRRRRYSSAAMTEASVTLIVDLPNDWPLSEDKFSLLSRLQTTVQSLLGGAQMNVNELVIVSHGPVPLNAHLAGQITAYIQTLESERMRATFFVDAGKSLAAARNTALKKTTGSIVVFADINVVGTVGWLKPLASTLLYNKSVAIVQPHFDDATNFPKTYSRTSDRLVVNYVWPLTSSIAESVDLVANMATGQQWLYRSPTVHGNIFAVRRNAFVKIGGYDVPLSDFGDRQSAGAHVELSIRTWLCGATIQTVLCSRVGLRDLQKLGRVKVEDPTSVRRIGNLWFASKKDVLFRSAELSAAEEKRPYGQRFDTDSKSVEHKHCLTIDWYFQNVVKDVLIPSDTALYFGQLKAKTGVCAHLNELDRVDVVDCSLAMLFELTTSGHLRVAGGDKCLAVQSNSYVVATQCFYEQQQQQQQQQQQRPAGGDPIQSSERQLWQYVPAAADANSQGSGDGGRLLINTWSGFCAMHVTDPLDHSVRWRQIVMAQNCSADFRRSAVSFSSDTVQFTLWQFVNA